MGARARGLLLFSFAFSSVLSSSDITVPSNDKHTEPNSSAMESSKSNTSINVAINRGCSKGGSCNRDRSGVDGIRKREISYSLMNKEGELKKAVDVLGSESGSPYPVNANIRMNDDIEKRARVGFTGMRGKKDSYLSHNYDKGTPPGEESLNAYLDVLEKRSRMGFNGMRGKKYDSSSEKRGRMMAFHGMRGKRFGEYGIYPERLRGFGGFILSDAVDGGELPEEGFPTSEKRTLAFHGMRGRRNENPVFVKRFLFPSYDMPGEEDAYDFKRSTGFLGMRGKKTPETAAWEEYGKRGIQSGFFGMKGKKAQSGFFGMRGKKSLADILGVDGDRESLVNEVNTIRTLNHSDSSQDRVRRAAKWLKNSKKAKNAFFAVRGKKSAENESELNFISSLE